MLSEELEVTLGAAVNYARSHRHEIITVEHLLYALLDDNETSKTIHLCGGILIL
ncbi:MAG: Clp protease N-terminal domain-containing protein [bacterium]